jgi:signal peptidase II
VRRKALIPLFVAAPVVVLDQASKLVVTRGMFLNQTIEVIGGFFNIVYVINTGAAFSILRDGGSLRTLVLIGASVAALVVIGALIRRAEGFFTPIYLSLIAGGAFGNLIDRVRYGGVVDFLDFHVGRYHWPAFNVADSAITAGVAAALYSSIFLKGAGRDRG